MQQKIVIIPDIHNKYDIAESIIDRERPDRTIFLGDYFDSMDDDAEVADRTAGWLAGSLERSDRTHLIGNHDLHYMADNREYLCSGYSAEKKTAIDRHNIDWTRLRMYCWIHEDWLCTHAGLSNRLFVQQRRTASETVPEFLRRLEEDLVMVDYEDEPHPFFQVGLLRGGTDGVGGIFWCDYDEFVDILGTKQIFGHTRGHSVRHRAADGAEHYCIDTVLRNYAIYEDQQMFIKSARTVHDA